MRIEATYIDHMGSDLTVVNAARVSFGKRHVELEHNDPGLIEYLASHGHWTPFTHCALTLHIKAPIFVRTQCFKHKVGFTENEISRRYVDSSPEFFGGIKWRDRSPNKKQGSGDTHSGQDELTNAYGEACFAAFAAYKFLLAKGVAPEQARMILPQSTMTEWYWTGSLSAWARFYLLRIDPDAQEETRELAQLCGVWLATHFPLSWDALTKRGRVSALP